MTGFVRIQDLAVGKWRSLLPTLGVPANFLTGRHGPCPMCGGKDRFRFDDKAGSGSFFCSRCGAGSGVDLVMRVNKLPFVEARKLIEQQLPGAKAEVGAAKRQTGSTDRAVDLWRAGRQLSGNDPASWYLARRGLTLANYPSQLRFLPKAAYWHDDKSKTEHPAMAALFVAPDLSSSTVHFTYLDGAGHKATVPKPKKLAQGRVPLGGAVRLAPSAERMGIAEGIETALSAAQLFGVPVWAALSAGALLKWQPPAAAREIVIFGDNDASFTGQHVAYGLAYRLTTEGYRVSVELPPDGGSDWNDQLEEPA